MKPDQKDYKLFIQSNDAFEKITACPMEQFDLKITYFSGYCDVFSKCRPVNADGPLSRMSSMLLNPVLHSKIRFYSAHYWWVKIFKILNPDVLI